MVLWRSFSLVLKPCTALSALIRVFNGILLANDSGDYVILVLLDLTAAFDIVDRKILIAQLKHLVGNCGIALEWLRSYLADIIMCLNLAGSESQPAPLSYGIPQGSILGPLLFYLIYFLWGPFSESMASFFIFMLMTAKFLCL